MARDWILFAVALAGVLISVLSYVLSVRRDAKSANESDTKKQTDALSALAALRVDILEMKAEILASVHARHIDFERANATLRAELDALEARVMRIEHRIDQ